MLIKQLEEVKLLGVIIDNKLSWDNHIKKVVTKMGNAISIIKRCATNWTHQLVRPAIQALVLSNLDYCSIVWSTTSLSNIRKLQLVQNKAARVALSCGWRTYVIKMQKSLGWLDVKTRFLSLLMVFIKCHNKKITLLFIEICLSVQWHITIQQGMQLEVVLLCQYPRLWFNVQLYIGQCNSGTHSIIILLN